MPSEVQHKVTIDGRFEMELILAEGVFEPTGTSLALIKAIAQELAGEVPLKVLDLGCGSGVVGLALARLGLAQQPLYASDLSEPAVVCAQRNAAEHGIAIAARGGRLFEPWGEETFEIVVDDVSGVAQDVAQVSPWFQGVPCESGPDGTDLVVEVLAQASKHLCPRGRLFFPAISLSDEGRILKAARRCFSSVRKLRQEEWPLPKGMYVHRDLLYQLREEEKIWFSEKFGMILFRTSIYCAT